MDLLTLLSIPSALEQNVNLAWTFLLLNSRFSGLFLLVPGLSLGTSGLAFRLPAILVLSATALHSAPLAPVPPDMGVMIAGIASEFLLGAAMGSIPLLIVAGVQLAGQLSSTSMGLGASQLIDPTSGGSIADVARIMGDLVVLLFLLIGGHHVIIYAASGMGGDLPPGVFVMGEQSIMLLLGRAANVFHLGMILSSPVIVALLLTQFVMGLIARAVSTVNVFIIAFPLTIGIGLILSILALPDIMKVMGKELTVLENSVEILANDRGN